MNDILSSSLDIDKDTYLQCLKLVSSKRLKHVDRFLGNFLGEGTFGTVYSHMSLAVKQMRVDGYNVEYREALSELHIMSTLSKHPNIVRLRGYAIDGDLLQIFMTRGLSDLREMIHGNSKHADTETWRAVYIDGLVDRTRSNIERDVLRMYTTDILSAVKHMHRQGFLHRDIKPANILLKGNGHLMLCDMGAAVSRSPYRCHSVKGTFAYSDRSILLCKYEMTYTPEADMWSVGCVLAEMFTGVVVVNVKYDHGMESYYQGYYKDRMRMVECIDKVVNQSEPFRVITDRQLRMKVLKCLRVLTVVGPDFSLPSCEAIACNYS